MGARDRDDDNDHEDEEEQRTERRRTRAAEQSVGAVATSTLRVLLGIIGLILLLFAVGQLVGIDLLAILSDALDTPEARWTFVAIFALMLLIIAVRGFD